MTYEHTKNIIFFLDLLQVQIPILFNIKDA